MCEIRRDGLRIAFSVFLILQAGNVAGQINEELAEELYKMYRDVERSEPSSSLRRLFKNDREYNIHIERLKEVNGFKRHNLLIKEVLRSEANPIIYINNPVESKFPNTYLSLEEFKRVLSERVKKGKENFHKTKKNEILKVTIKRKSAKMVTILSKRETKLVKTTFFTSAKSFSINKNNVRAQLDKSKVMSTYATSKFNIADTTHTNYVTNITKLITLNKSNEINLSTHVSTPTSTLETRTNIIIHNNSVSSVTENLPENITSDYIIHENASTTNIFSTSDNTVTENVINITDSHSKEQKEELKLEKNRDITSETILTTQETLGATNSFASELIPEDISSAVTTTESQGSTNRVPSELIPEDNISSDVTTSEFTTQEVKSEASTTRKTTTAPTTTKSRWRTLGRPRVFIGR